ncbi:uncharacterized protein LOC120075889 [Benincasa hispida]|uniref:uncharacterized protein LOC120075889 n=1 Tax=Benincasa hispida TaxID=102211 RepID=UPI0018FFD46F|nr:uncharacterized protein LOC120075889 [Benincasa hispida]
MEVPVLNRITEIGADLSSLPNPKFLSRIFTSFSPSQHFWKWGALIIALLATFTGIINRVKILIIVIRRRTRTTSISEPLYRSLHGGETGGLVSENLKSPLLSSSESEDENEGDRKQDDSSDFRVKGSGRFSGEFDGRCCSRLRRRHCDGGGDGDLFSWPCFGSDGSVVRQWGDVKLKCEFEELSGSVISLYDENEETEICSIFNGGTPLQAAALSPRKMVVAASEGVSANVSLKLWDMRGRSRRPVVAAEWDSPSGKIVDVYYEDVENVYLRDKGAAGIMVGDVRKVSSASGNSPVGSGDGLWESGH